MTRIQKTYQILNIFLLILAMACLFYYDYEGGLALKGITSGWFAALGAVNLVFVHQAACKGRSFAWLVVTALFLCMTADVLLGIDFMVGTLTFAVGHLFYFGAYCRLEPLRRRDLFPIAAVGVVSLLCVLGTPFIQVDDPMLQGLLVGYALVISCMLGKAIGNLRYRYSRTRLLLVIGSGLFWFSDLMLALNMFGSGGRLTGILCMYTYWPGQSLLAHTLYHFATDEQA